MLNDLQPDTRRWLISLYRVNAGLALELAYLIVKGEMVDEGDALQLSTSTGDKGPATMPARQAPAQPAQQSLLGLWEDAGGMEPQG
jgi:hypothetical protein